MTYRGGGGFNYNDLYNMPVNLRSFYYMKLAEAIAAENKKIEEANKGKGAK